jgi:hypothetical protein
MVMILNGPQPSKTLNFHAAYLAFSAADWQTTGLCRNVQQHENFAIFPDRDSGVGLQAVILPMAVMPRAQVKLWHQLDIRSFFPSHGYG